MSEQDSPIHHITLLLYRRAKYAFDQNSSPIKEYIFNYCLHHLRESVGADKVSKRYECYIDNILKQTFNYLLKSPEKVFIGSRLKKGMARFELGNYRYWQRLSNDDKVRRASDLVIQKKSCYSHLSFFDLQLINSDDAFGANRILDAPAIDEWKLSHTLTWEELALTITRYMCAHHTTPDFEVDAAFDALTKWIDEAINKKKKRNNKRVSKVVEGLSVTVLLKRIRNQEAQEFHFYSTEQSSKNKKKASVPDIARIAYNSFLRSYWSLKELDAIAALPRAKQASQLIFCFQANAQRSKTRVEENLLSYGAPLSRDDAQAVAAGLSKSFKTMSKMSSKDVAVLCKPSLDRFKRLKDLGIKDQEQMKKHFLHIAMSKIKLKIKEPFEDSLISLYLDLRRTGVTKARVRALFNAIYDTYTISELDPDAPQPRRAHDFLLGYEPLLRRFAKRYTPRESQQPGLNRFFAMLLSEIGGAQGNSVHAFKHWSLLPKILKNPKVLALPFRNLQEINTLLFRDPQTELKLSQLLSKQPLSHASNEQLIEYSGQRHCQNKFLRRLRHLLKEEATGAAKSAITLPLKMSLDDLHIEILPNHDVLGHLGASVNGVCIPYDGPAHRQHHHKGVANLIVRDEQHVLLWGLLARLQCSEEPMYYLNNLQGSLPGRYAKNKHLIKRSIRELLGQLGQVVSLPFFFNALNLIDDDDPVYHEQFILPHMRLDLVGEELSQYELPDRLKGGKYALFNRENTQDVRLLSETAQE